MDGFFEVYMRKIKRKIDDQDDLLGIYQQNRRDEWSFWWFEESGQGRCRKMDVGCSVMQRTTELQRLELELGCASLGRCVR